MNANRPERDAIGTKSLAAELRITALSSNSSVESRSLKTVWALDNAQRAQSINYLQATGKHLCLLLNFGTPRQEFQRVVQDL
jgi:GxxExxY protein